MLTQDWLIVGYLAITLAQAVVIYRERRTITKLITTLRKRDATITEQAKYISDMEQDHAADCAQARESGMALTVREARKEGFLAGIGQALLSDTASREREAVHGRGV